MKRKSNCLATILFLIYLALLVWIILFKLQFSISDLDKVRSINLIPFHYDKEIEASRMQSRQKKRKMKLLCIWHMIYAPLSQR